MFNKKVNNEFTNAITYVLREHLDQKTIHCSAILGYDHKKLPVCRDYVINIDTELALIPLHRRPLL